MLSNDRRISGDPIDRCPEEGAEQLQGDDRPSPPTTIRSHKNKELGDDDNNNNPTTPLLAMMKSKSAPPGDNGDAMTLDTASLTVDDWTTASETTRSYYSSRGYEYSSRRSSLTSSSRRSSLTSAMSGSTGRRGSVQSSICSYDDADADTATMSRRGSTASEVSHDGTALSSATGTTTASTRRRRLFFGLVTTVEFDKHQPANRRLNDKPATVSHPTEARWDSTPVPKRKLLSTRRRKSGTTGGGADADAGAESSFSTSGAPSIPTRSSSFPAPDRGSGTNSSARAPGGDRRSSIEIKRPRRRMSVEDVKAPSSSSPSSLSNFLIPLEITSGGSTMEDGSQANPGTQASKEGRRRRGSSWMPHIPRRRGSVEQPTHHAPVASGDAAPTPRSRRLSVEMAARRASLEMPVVVEEESDELEVSAPFVLQQRSSDEEDDSSVATLSALLPEAEETCRTAGASEDVNDSSYSSCLTDTSSSSRNVQTELAGAELPQDDSYNPEDDPRTRVPSIKKPSPSKFDHLFADDSAEIVTSVPFSSGAATRRRRLSLVDKVQHPPPNRPQIENDATPPAPPTHQSSGARRGSFLTNLFASLSYSSSGSGSSSDGTREFPHERSATNHPKASVAGSQNNEIPGAGSTGGTGSPSPSRSRSRLRSSLSPRLPRRVPSDGSSPSEDETFAAGAASRSSPTTDRPCRQPARRSSLLSLLHSFASRIEDDLEAENEGPFSAVAISPAPVSSSSLPKQPRRRPSHQLDQHPSPAAATRRSRWQLLAIEKPHKSENDVPTDRRMALPESPPRAASEPSRRGSLLGMLLFFRTSSSCDEDSDPAVALARRNNSTASSTDESDDEPADGKAGRGVPAAECEPPRRRDGIKPAPFLRRHASCDGRFETVKAPSSRVLCRDDSASEAWEGGIDDDPDARRSSMVVSLPSRKMTLEPNHPLYRVGDNGQQATIATGVKGRGGRRRWSLISNLPGRRSVTGASQMTVDNADLGVDSSGTKSDAKEYGTRSCSDSALLVPR